MEKEIIVGKERVVVHDFNFVGQPSWEKAELILRNLPNGLF
ncbi:hypothetical protein [Bacillus sp. OV166]|nr:hypothetical protein [Bacillus sp. OV166]